MAVFVRRIGTQADGYRCPQRQVLRRQWRAFKHLRTHVTQGDLARGLDGWWIMYDEAVATGRRSWSVATMQMPFLACPLMIEPGTGITSHDWQSSATSRTNSRGGPGSRASKRFDRVAAE